MSHATTVEPEELRTLPALRRLGDLRDVRPMIVIDTREQTPLSFTRLASERGTLHTGDYSFRGGEELFAVERKTIPDLVACVSGENRDRFCRELHRLRGYRFRRLLVVGTRETIDHGHYPQPNGTERRKGAPIGRRSQIRCAGRIRIGCPCRRASHRNLGVVGGSRSGGGSKHAGARPRGVG